MAAVRLLPDNHIVFDTPLTLDLGDIAKGFAVGRAVPIHLRDPVDPPAVRFAGKLQNGAIATSSAAAILTRFGPGQVSALDLAFQCGVMIASCTTLGSPDGRNALHSPAMRE